MDLAVSRQPLLLHNYTIHYLLAGSRPVKPLLPDNIAGFILAYPGALLVELCRFNSMEDRERQRVELLREKKLLKQWQSNSVVTFPGQ